MSGVTVGLPGYSSARYDATARATLDEGEEMETAQSELDDRINQHVNEVAQFIAKYHRLPVALDFKRSGSTDP